MKYFSFSFGNIMGKGISKLQNSIQMISFNSCHLGRIAGELFSKMLMELCRSWNGDLCAFQRNTQCIIMFIFKMFWPNE